MTALGAGIPVQGSGKLFVRDRSSHTSFGKSRFRKHSRLQGAVTPPVTEQGGARQTLGASVLSQGPVLSKGIKAGPA